MAAPNPRDSPAYIRRPATAPSPSSSLASSDTNDNNNTNRTNHNNNNTTSNNQQYYAFSSPIRGRTQPPSLPLVSPPDDASTSYKLSSSSNSSSVSGSAGKMASVACSSGASGSGSGCGSSGGNRTNTSSIGGISHTSGMSARTGSRTNTIKYKNDKDNKALCKKAQMENDAMVYLDGPQVYTCGQCRTHLTSHDDIMSKAFHGRHGRAYLFDQCVNIRPGPPEIRQLMTGLHSVSDIFCKRCNHCVGWTYVKAYEPSQKYKEGKFIIEKINLHLEESDYYDIEHPAGERGDKWRVRSMSWGSSGSGRDWGMPSSPRMSGLGSNHLNNYLQGGAPLTPPPPVRRNRVRSGSGMVPQSPRSPGDIIYEYRNDSG